MAVVQVGAMVTALADGCTPGHRRVAGWVTHLGVRGLIDSAALVDAAPWLTWRVPSPAILLVAAYYAAAVVAFVSTTRVLFRLSVAISLRPLLVDRRSHLRRSRGGSATAGSI